MTQEEVKKSAWSWKFFSEDFLKIKKNQEEPQKNIAVSLFAAFFIVLISAQILGFANTIYDKKILMEKYKNVNVVVYSSIC